MISDLRNETRTRDIITEKRITNLEQGLPAERWSVDDSVAYTKDVPENALPFASVDMIGGMTRKCTNLFDFESWKTTAITTNGSMTYGENSVTLSATNNDSFTVSDTVKVMVVPGKTYTISFEESDTTVSSDCHLFKNGQVDDSMLVYQDSPYTFVAADDAEFYTVRFGVSLAGNTLTFSNIRINEGATALPYEPYFEGLRSAPVTEVESVGVNRLGGITFANVIKATVPGAVIGAGDKTISYRASQVDDKVFFADFKSNKQYTIIIKGFGSNVYANMAIRYTDGTNESLKQFSAANTVLTLCHVTNATKSVAALVGSCKDGNTTLYYDDCGIFEGVLTEADFVPYCRNTLPVPAEVQALDGYGWGVNADCYNYIDWEKKQFVKRVKKVVLVGSESEAWSVYTNSDSLRNDGYCYCIRIGDRKVSVNSSICSRFNNVARAWDVGKVGDYGDGIVDLNIYFISDIPTLSEFLTYLSTNPVELCYELATPIETDLSDYFGEDNLIGVEGGGTVTMVNEYGYDVPSEITYQLKGAEA